MSSVTLPENLTDGGTGDAEVEVVVVVVVVERVADAVIERLESCGNADIEAGIGTILGLGSEEQIAAFKKLIGTAAIAAIREPTEAMLRVGAYRLSDDRGNPGSEDEAAGFWESMIDAALSEGHREKLG